MTTNIRIGSKIELSTSPAHPTGTVTGKVTWEDAKKPGVFHVDKDAVEVTWDATGITTAEWKADLSRI